MGLSPSTNPKGVAAPDNRNLEDPISFHNIQAANWESNYRTKAFLTRVNAFERALGERPLDGMQWLDAGCGTGTLTRWLVSRGAKVVGIDGAPEMIRVAQSAVQENQSECNVSFQVANVSDLPFYGGMFDGVLCSSVLEYADDPQAYLKELARVVKRGGMLLISVPNAESLERLGLRMVYRLTSLIGRPRPRYMAHSHHQFSRLQFISILRSHGFQTDHVAPFGSGFNGWLSSREWFGRLLLFRATKK